MIRWEWERLYILGKKKFSRNSLPHEKPMVWKVYEGIKVEYGGYLKTRLWIDKQGGQSTAGGMGY